MVPFVIIIILSFSRGIGRLNFVGIENYVNVINSPSFQLALANTLKFLIIGIPLIMIVSFIIALSINVKLPGFKYIKSTMLMPYILPISSLAIIIQIFITEHGIFNGALNYFGVDTVNLLQSDKAFVIVIVMYVWKNFGYNVILILVSLNAIPPQLYEAASIDGASSLQKVFSITIPMIIPN
ncbi:MAG: sugar ABC transporter permease, partial [Oscillospiraceae bacterium]